MAGIKIDLVSVDGSKSCVGSQVSLLPNTLITSRMRLTICVGSVEWLTGSSCSELPNGRLAQSQYALDWAGNSIWLGTQYEKLVWDRRKCPN